MPNSILNSNHEVHQPPPPYDYINRLLASSATNLEDSSDVMELHWSPSRKYVMPSTEKLGRTIRDFFRDTRPARRKHPELAIMTALRADSWVSDLVNMKEMP